MADQPHGGGLTATYTPELWATVLVPYVAAASVPLPFAVAWIAEESGGNPCAIGSPTQYGPDGAPREMGIGQFYNPDDLSLLKIGSGELRAYCSPKKVTYHLKDGRTVQGPSQEVIRPLTADEMGAQAKAIVDKIVHSRTAAAHYAAASGITWPSSGVDFWRLVKLVHGLPGLVTTGIAAVTKYLGRAPSSWSEYRTLLQSGTVHADANTEKYRGEFASVFDNAEKCTSTMQGASNV